MVQSSNPVVQNAINSVARNERSTPMDRFMLLKLESKAQAIEYARKHMKELDAQAKREGMTGWPKVKAQLGL